MNKKESNNWESSYWDSYLLKLANEHHARQSKKKDCLEEIGGTISMIMAIGTMIWIFMDAFGWFIFDWISR